MLRCRRCGLLGQKVSLMREYGDGGSGSNAGIDSEMKEFCHEPDAPFVNSEILL